MLRDRYDNPISTTSAPAQAAYINGADAFLAGGAGSAEMFEEAIGHDPEFAMAHMGLARVRQMQGRGADAQSAREVALGLAETASEQEQGHLDAMGELIAGRGAIAYPKMRAQTDAYPRDALAAQTCTSVFGLIGFSGQPGREAEQLAYTTKLLPHYGDDWWFLSMHAFAQAEVGQISQAAETIERSLNGNPRSAHGAHIKAHIHYEAGETEAGFDFMRDWYVGFEKEAMLHCHISWHIALWALEKGDIDLMWQTVDDSVRPGGAWGPALNLLTDTASILYRAEMAGVHVPQERWQEVSEYAAKFFPKPGIAFADVHAALAHAMAGNTEGLEKIRTEGTGPAGDLVRGLAEAFSALAAKKWPEATTLLLHAMADHARLGGSRAQRDLIEYALLNALLKQGQDAQAQMFLATRRPLKSDAHAVAGL
ncbi:MAG: tetratricopeptide repeat protein [Pseudomonadota bacterium]